MQGDREPVEVQPTEYVETIDLIAHANDLGRQLGAGREAPAGRLWGLPDLGRGDCWVDTAGASVLAGVASSTITAWLARGGPKRCPFPAPVRVLYRLYWPKTTVEQWAREYRATRRSNDER